ncbi:MAG TPA: TorF family putative porin, partial [Burkholderiaceae bacterium]|nr:TorF family putative porin [Burkholderiaceae bacterium]
MTIVHALKTAALAAAVIAPQFASAQAAAPQLPPALTANVALVSDYRFRGISQSFRQPALQGGFDWAHPSGAYLGNWNSSVSGIQYPNGASLETDFYGGYKFDIATGVTADVGGILYYYPGAYYSGFAPARPRFTNFEVYGGVGVGPFTAKLYVSATDFFG